MQGFVDRLLKLNVNFDEELAIDIILHSLPPCYDQFHMAYHMNKEEITLNKLQGLLRTAESSLKGKYVVATSSGTKVGSAIPSSNPKEVECFHFHEKGHWKRSCPKYLQDIKDGKINDPS